MDETNKKMGAVLPKTLHLTREEWLYLFSHVEGWEQLSKKIFTQVFK